MSRGVGTSMLPAGKPDEGRGVTSTKDSRVRGPAPVAASSSVGPSGAEGEDSRAPPTLPHVCVPWPSSSPHAASAHHVYNEHLITTAPPPAAPGATGTAGWCQVRSCSALPGASALWCAAAAATCSPILGPVPRPQPFNATLDRTGPSKTRTPQALISSFPPSPSHLPTTPSRYYDFARPPSRHPLGATTYCATLRWPSTAHRRTAPPAMPLKLANRGSEK